MVFEFQTGGGPGFMTAFAAAIGRKFENGLLVLPRSLGKGYIKALDLDPMIRMMIHDYELKEDLTFRRISTSNRKEVITLTFHNIFHQHSPVKKSKSPRHNSSFLLPSVQVTSADINFETFFPAHVKINTIIISVHVNLLKGMLSAKNGHPFLDNILTGRQSYLYEEVLSPQMQEVAAKIAETDAPEQLRNFYFKLMAEELVYFLLLELVKRESAPTQPINNADAKKIYAIRDRILADITSPPNLTELADFSGMSESKMKRLFRQVFGNSIYNYYQACRMQQAAYLIKEQKLSVSETGYQLGFSNLSHFTRLFEKHLGLKPKKYSLS